MKKWLIIKTILFSIFAMFIFIMNDNLINYLSLVVGISFLIYGLDEILFYFLNRKIMNDHSNIIDGTIKIICAIIILILLKESDAKVCLVWAILSIQREVKEGYHACFTIKNKKIGFFNLFESIIVIVLSMLLIIDYEEHVMFHIILLGIELLLEVIFEWSELIYDKYKNKQIGKN